MSITIKFIIAATTVINQIILFHYFNPKYLIQKTIINFIKAIMIVKVIIITQKDY
jgi:hypothetical protein